MKLLNSKVEGSTTTYYFENEVEKTVAELGKSTVTTWTRKGKFHRLEGPAIEVSTGGKAWYIEGVKYSEKGFNNKVKKLMEVK